MCVADSRMCLCTDEIPASYYSPSRSFPILVYFKETQTPEENWNIGPGEQANSEEAVAKGAVRGQVHFFPAIANTEDLIRGFERHGCAKL